jgi:hypothetical protein
MSITSNDIDTITGVTVRGTDNDKIGSVGQVYVDADGTPVWATVKTGLFGTSESSCPCRRPPSTARTCRSATPRTTSRTPLASTQTAS